MTWFDASETLPPVDMPIIAQWADGSEAPAVLRDLGNAWGWETEHPTDELPVAWRFDSVSSHAAAKSISLILPLLIVLPGMLILALVGQVLLALSGLALLALLWAIATGAGVMGDRAMSRGGPLVGLIVAVVLFGIPALAVFVFLILPHIP